MTNTSVTLIPSSANDQRLINARAGFLVGYPPTTRTNYSFGLKQWFSWCDMLQVHPLDGVQRPHIDMWGRWLEENRKLAPASVQHHLSILRSFYRYCEDEHLIEHSPAARIRLPKVSSESSTAAMSRTEVAQLIAISNRNATFHALVCLLSLNGLRVSEACRLNIEDLDFAGGHRTMTVIRKGNKRQLLPLSPKTARALDAAIGERKGGPILLTAIGTRVTPNNAYKTIGRLGRQAGIKTHLHPHMLRHAFVTVALDAGVPLHDVQDSAGHADPRTTMRYNRNRFNLDRNATHIVTAFVAGG